jgi:hypothetical protein
MAEFARRRDEAPNAVVKAAWDRLLEGWDDQERHDAFLRVVVDEAAYAWAAARFREKQPDERATTGIDRVRRAAEARLATMATIPPPMKSASRFGSVKLLLAGAVVMVIALLLALQFLRGRHQRTEQPLGKPHPPAMQPGTKVR